jgi:ATP-independent RNA helicase DbpA
VPTDFASLSLSPALIKVVAELGYEHPTPIQVEAIPALLAGRDLIGQSKTGSGKTAAFALPILQRLDLEKRAVQALVICPTRELSAQVAREFRRLGRGHPGLTVVELVGGQRSRPQADALRRGAHVVVGTPGRLLDQLQSVAFETDELATLVLDEADRMLDMGFGEEVSGILRDLPDARQTALFSATFPESIETMSASCQRDAVRVTIGEPEGADVEIRELRLAVDPQDRFHALCWLLDQHPHESALIFCNFKATVAELANTLANADLSADRLDGDLDQFHRDQVLARFRNHSVRLLVATDVAGRGIDIKELDLVINFEVPQQAETYVHRIGRTGRAGKKGVAITLTTIGQDTRIKAIEALTGTPIEEIIRSECDQLSLGVLLRSLAQRAKMETILISGGRKDKVRAGDILGALTGDAGGLESAQVGKIEIQDRLSYVAVAKSVSRLAVDRLNQGRIKGKRFRATLVGGPGARGGGDVRGSGRDPRGGGGDTRGGGRDSRGSGRAPRSRR